MLARTAIGAPFPSNEETNILIVSPLGWLANAVQQNLNRQGKSMHWATDRREAEICLTFHTYDLCIIDAASYGPFTRQIVLLANRTFIRPRLNLIGIPQESEHELLELLHSLDEYSIQ